jgi:hypothetical protein
MNKNLFALAVVIISALAITKTTNAQSSNVTGAFEHHNYTVAIDKLMPARDKAANDAINAKALRDFGKYYKGAPGVTWHKNEHGYTACFVLNDINTAVYFDKKGRWQGSLKTYDEANLDRNVRGVVKSKYYDYKILNVQEVETIDSGDTPTYLVYLKDHSDFKLARVHEGAMDIYAQFIEQ